MFLYSRIHPRQIIRSGLTWLCLEILTKSTDSLGLFFALGAAVSILTPSLVNAEMLIFRDFSFMTHFGLLLASSGSIAVSQKSDPIGHDYPSCFPHILLLLVPRRVTRYHTFCSAAGCLSNPL